ncbi:MAG: hypothetical protein SGI72_15925, partial [Planctomycetota bacterium]|nr:hypothetical protein [Planctomycetota bacterium]
MTRFSVVLVLAAFVAGCASHAPLNSVTTPTLSGAGVAPDSPVQSAKRAMEIKDFFRATGVGAPALSPDGTKMVFTLKRQDLEAGTSKSEIWLANIDGSSARALTSSKKADASPTFAPDGKTIVFTSNRSGTAQLWTMPIDGGEARQLTDFAL